LKKQKLVDISRNLLAKHKELKDIILIGSFIKGKEDYVDIDLVFVFKEENQSIIDEAYVDYEKEEFPVEITRTRLKDFFDELPLWQSILHEGFSINKNEFVYNLLGMRSMVLFQYELTHLNKTKKQSFAHALFGTGGRVSFLDENSGRKLGKGVIVVPLEESETFREFFETWEIMYKVKRIWM